MKKHLTVRIGAIVVALAVAFFSILPELVSAEGDDAEPLEGSVLVAEEQKAEGLEEAAASEGNAGEPEIAVPEDGGAEVQAPGEEAPAETPDIPQEEGSTETQTPDDAEAAGDAKAPGSTETQAPDAETSGSTETQAPDAETPGSAETQAPDAEAPGSTETQAPDAEVPGSIETKPAEGNILGSGSQSLGAALAAPEVLPVPEVAAENPTQPESGAMDTIADYMAVLADGNVANVDENGFTKRYAAGFDMEALAELFENDEKDFEIEGSMLIRYTGTDAYVAIPGRVTAIGDGAFSGNTTILGVGFPSNLQSIGSQAFSGCSNLVSVSIPDTVSAVGASAFANCSGLADVYTGAGSGVISANEFANCTSLQSIAVPEGILALSSGAFAGCSNLSSVSLPSTMASIDASAFSGDVNLASIAVASGSYASYDGCIYTADGTQLLLCPQGKTGISFAPGMKSVASGAFSGCNYLLSAVIPNAAGAIEANAFSGSAIKAVTIPSGVNAIGTQAGWTPNVIYGYRGSAAERWANASNYVFESLDGTAAAPPAPAEPEQHIEDSENDSSTESSDSETASKPGTKKPKVNLSAANAAASAAGTSAEITRNSARNAVATPKTGVEDYSIYFLAGGLFLFSMAFFAYSRKLLLDGNRVK